ncbi:MAG: glyoxylate/hydroxypyruvate reductase A [Cyanobacteria bacterium P01_F01_bin.150]
MIILVLTTLDPADLWLTEVVKILKQTQSTWDVRIWPECGHYDDINIVLAWWPPLGIIQQLINLQLICSLGAGVDHILRDPHLPHHVPIVRAVYDELPRAMVEYVLWAILAFKLQITDYQELQRSHRWQELPDLQKQPFTVGILGLGAMGAAVAQSLVTLGLSVRGWSRRAKTLDGVECFHGDMQLNTFLSECSVIVCLLPLTSQTQGILSCKLFASLPKGAYLINVGRGQHLIEDDLVSALASGQLSGACLDVFEPEPLPSNHPFWDHPRIILTPHIACISQPQLTVRYIADTITQTEAGITPAHIVNRDQGY